MWYCTKKRANVAARVTDTEDIMAPDYLMAPISWRLKLEKYRIILLFFYKLTPKGLNVHTTDKPVLVYVT
jgi:hypothetical protein